MSKLVGRAKKGDQEALLELIMTEKEAYYKLAYVFLRDKEEALDALEDMIVILYDKVAQLRDEDAFYSWSKTILVNRCKKRLKEKSKIVSLEVIKEKDKENSDSDQELINKESQLFLEEGLKRLSSKHAEVIRLRYFLDLEYEMIGKLLEIPLGTVKSRLAIGLKKLEQILGGDYRERH